MKIVFNSDDDLPLVKQLKFYAMVIIVRSMFEEDGELHTQFFLDECLYGLEILEYNGIDISEVIYINKTNASK